MRRVRNPWPLFGVLSVTAAILILFDTYLSYGLVWVAGIGILVLFVAFLVFYVNYNAWLVRKINPYVLAYREDHDIEKLKKGFARWKSWMLTEYAKNSMTVNLLTALLEQPRTGEFEEEAQKLKERAVTTQEWQIYHFFMAEYAKRTGDGEAEERERRLSQELKEKAERKKQMAKEPATAAQSRRAFLLWLSFDMFLFACGLFCFAGGFFHAIALQSTSLFSIAAAAFILSFFVLPIVIGWLAVWLMRRRKENQENGMQNREGWE